MSKAAVPVAPRSVVPSHRIDLKKDAAFDEAWLHSQIAENPTLLGLGDLEVLRQEVRQPTGRLDLLLTDPETDRRYEVEIQLGRMDPGHIVRTIEYWDIESRRYPQYEHVAVLVAEDVTTRYLNVILRISGQIPIIVLKINVLDVDGTLTLVATRVLDMISLGPDTEVPDTPSDRAYWEAKASDRSLEVVDSMIGLIGEIEEGIEPNYVKHYIGLSQRGRSQNFVEFRPRKGKFAIVTFKVLEEQDRQEELEEAGMDMLAYKGGYRLRLLTGEIRENRDLLLSLIRDARDLMLGARTG